MSIEQTKEAIKVLQAMRRRVKVTHWIKGKYVGEKIVRRNNRYFKKEVACLVGMCNLKTGYNAYDDGPTFNRDGLVDDHYEFREPQDVRETVLGSIIRAVYQRRPRSRLKCVESYNDARQTTRDDVVETLTVAISDLKARLKAA